MSDPKDAQAVEELIGAKLPADAEELHTYR
jgi:hypothetical protein